MAQLKPKNLKLAFQLVFEGQWPTSVAFLGSGERLAAANRAGEIYIWDLSREPSEEKIAENKERYKDRKAPSLSPVQRLEGHTNAISHLVATRDGKQLISASYDHTIRIWNPDAKPSGKAEAVMDQNWRKRQAEKKRNEETLDAPGVEVDVVTESTVLEGHGDWINALGISRDEKRLISGDDKSLSIVWDLSSQKEVARWSGYPVDWVTSAALTPDGKTAFTAEYTSSRGSFDRPPAQARFWNADSGEMKLDVLAIQFPDDKRENSYGYGKKWGQFMGRGFVCADISPDGKLLAVGQGGETGKGQIHLIEVETGKVARTVADHRYGVCDVKFSDDGKYVLSTGRDTTLEIDQVSDGKEIARLGESRGGQFKDWLDGLAISPDSQWVAAADIAGIVQVWRSEG